MKSDADTQRKHFAVIVAEGITRRFFNVIQLLSQSIPIIAVQANVVGVNGQRALRFTTVLDMYGEEEDPGVTNTPSADYEATWRKVPAT